VTKKIPLLSSLFSFLTKLGKAGIRPEDGFHEKRKIQISNYLIIYLFAINGINLYLFGVYYWQPILFFDALTTMAFSVFAFFLHKKGFRNFTRNMIFVGIIASLTNASYQFGNSTGVQFYMLFLTILSFLLFDDYRIIFGYTFLICLVFLLHDFYFQYQPRIVDPALRFSYYPNFGMAFLMYVFVIFNFRYESDKYQEIVELQNKDLSTLTFKMMLQKDEALISSNLLKQKSSILEQQNKSIYESLRLASMLQNETLPSEEELFLGLKAGMLLYKPKKIVSGDFYWAKRTYQGLILVVADCIGHGVPGGMMAIFASNLISQIVEEQGKTFPSDILEELDKRLRRRVKQGIHTELGDGMDIAVCLISDNRISFASAARPLIRITSNGRVQTIPGTRFQLATMQRENIEYETIEIDVEQGDRYYIFTDGANDQLSGKDGKRIGTKNLVKEIVQLQTLPLHKQKSELETLFLAWQGDSSQTDDILLVGFEV
jgi:serine phosphatase RsbU (regulator of sigma subunit)